MLYTLALPLLALALIILYHMTSAEHYLAQRDLDELSRRPTSTARDAAACLKAEVNFGRCRRPTSTAYDRERNDYLPLHHAFPLHSN